MSNIEKLGWGKQKTVKEVVEYLTTNEVQVGFFLFCLFFKSIPEQIGLSEVFKGVSTDC